ncbi:MAG: HD domain-containing protein [Planctomycetota bacterium]|nr:MAG: HD domain-containing protein [Planctomycetota bacterium]
MLRFENVVRDPVHGDIPLTQEELRILDTVEMQRLRNVRQLGAAYLIYPGAQHTRFEHSLGTAHLVSRLATEINKVRDREGGAQLGGYDEHEVRLIRIAALVHDATHLPFGHNIEDQTGLLPRHDKPDRFVRLFSDETDLGRVCRNIGVREEVLGILAPEAVSEVHRPPPHWRGLVSGTIDADMLDYLARDAMFTGLRLQYDPRIFGMFRVERRSQRLFVDLTRRGYLREALLSEVVRCLEARYYFSERVYYHHAKIAAGALVAKAVEIALLEGVIRFEDLQYATDAGLLHLLDQAEPADLQARRRLRTFVNALQKRRLPKRVAVYPVYCNREIQDSMIQRFFGAGSTEERRRVEERLGESVRFAVGKHVPVLLYCPVGTMQLKSARILVRWPGHKELAPLRNFAEQVPRLGDLEESYQRMWKFYVLALTDDPTALAALRELCKQEFPQAQNVLEEPKSILENI